MRLMNRRGPQSGNAVGREIPAMRGQWMPLCEGCETGAVDLCGGGSKRGEWDAGCGGMSADVWDFAESGAGANRGGKRANYQSVEGAEIGAEGRDLRAKKTDAERRGGGNCGERTTPMCWRR